MTSLAADRGRDDRDSFVVRIEPYLRRMRDEVRHEIRIAELEGRTPRGAVSVSDILDEVLERAWGLMAVHEPEQPLDVWLHGILQEVMDQMLSRPGETVPIDAPVDPKRLDIIEGAIPPASDQPLSLESRLNVEQPELAAAEHLAPSNNSFWPDRDPIRLEGMLPDESPSSDPEASLEAEESGEEEELEGEPGAPEERRPRGRGTSKK